VEVSILVEVYFALVGHSCVLRSWFGNESLLLWSQAFKLRVLGKVLRDEATTNTIIVAEVLGNCHFVHSRKAWVIWVNLRSWRLFIRSRSLLVLIIQQLVALSIG